jgi:hypothetical protein
MRAVQGDCARATRYCTILERGGPQVQTAVRHSLGGWGIQRVSLQQVRARIRVLTRVSVERSIVTGITIGARILFIIIVLFVLAYVCFIAAVCVTLKRARLALEQDYPLLAPPDGTHNERPNG